MCGGGGGGGADRHGEKKGGGGAEGAERQGRVSERENHKWKEKSQVIDDYSRLGVMYAIDVRGVIE